MSDVSDNESVHSADNLDNVLEASPQFNDTSSFGDDNDYDTVGDTTFETTYESERDESDDNEEVEEPPKLKYSRLNGLPANFFKRDPVSTCFFHESYFLFATHSGIIHITDTKFETIRTFKAHKASILSIYTDGSFFATGSMDGTVVIGSLKDEKDIVAFDFKRPVHAVVLDHNYAKTRSFVSGGMAGKVLYSSKNWLGQRSDVVLDDNNGPIVSLQTVDDLLIWMNDKGISIYHTATRSVIKVIEKPEDAPRSDLYWPRVHFLETDRVLIGWANYIWDLRISLSTAAKGDSSTASNKSRILPSAATFSFTTTQEKTVDIEHVYKLDSLIAGISSFKDDYWMVLSYDPPNNDDGQVEYHYPDLKLLNSLTGEVDFEEEIGLRSIEGLGLNDYTLGRHVGLDGTKYFIISAKDGVIAQEVQLDDRLQWFIERSRFKDAWDISEHLVSPLKRLNLGIQHTDDLVQQNNWEEATTFLSTILFLNDKELPDGDTKSTIVTTRSERSSGTNDKYDDEYVSEVQRQWEVWCTIYIKSNHIDLLTTIIPVTPKLSLPTSIYDDILAFWISNDINTFYDLIRAWDIELYDPQKAEQLIEQTLESAPSLDNLRQCLVDLYVKTFEPHKAIPHLIHLEDPNIVSFLSENHLLTTYIDELPKIILLRFENGDFSKLPLDTVSRDLKDIVEILVEKRHELSPHTIVKLMKQNHLGFINYLYLERLKEVDDFLVTPFGDERIQLFAQFNRGKLLPFLMKYSDYDIDKAIQLCEDNQFYEELVYLLGKIGENKKAITLIINEIDDPEIAINFAKHQNDREAWNILLDYSMEKPRFIKALIEGADDQSNPFYDPISIIKRIPHDIKIEGLKQSVTKISENNEINILLNQLILRIVYNRSENISNHYKTRLLRGLEINVGDPRLETLTNQFDTILIYNDTTDFKNPRLLSGNEFTPKVDSTKPFEDMSSKLRHLEILNHYLKSHKPQKA